MLPLLNALRRELEVYVVIACGRLNVLIAFEHPHEDPIHFVVGSAIKPSSDVLKPASTVPMHSVLSGLRDDAIGQVKNLRGVACLGAFQLDVFSAVKVEQANTVSEQDGHKVK